MSGPVAVQGRSGTMYAAPTVSIAIEKPNIISTPSMSSFGSSNASMNW